MTVTSKYYIEKMRKRAEEEVFPDEELIDAIKALRGKKPIRDYVEAYIEAESLRLRSTSVLHIDGTYRVWRPVSYEETEKVARNNVNSQLSRILFSDEDKRITLSTINLWFKSIKSIVPPNFAIGLAKF